MHKLGAVATAATATALTSARMNPPAPRRSVSAPRCSIGGRNIWTLDMVSPNLQSFADDCRMARSAGYHNRRFDANRGTPSATGTGRRPPCAPSGAWGVLAEDALQRASMHAQPPRRLRDVPVALLENPLDMLPAHPVGCYRLLRLGRQLALQ